MRFHHLIPSSLLQFASPLACLRSASFGRVALRASLPILLALLGGCNQGSTATSAPAVAPTITTQPAAQSAFVGDTPTFTVAANGTAPISYQWQRGGTAIAGATAASYTTPAVALTDDGALFTVTVSNSAGSVTSASAKLSVSAKPAAITTQPASTSVVDGSPATFSVAATGTAPLTYQWMRGSTAIAGATLSSYTLPAASITDSGSTFAVTVSNSAGTVTSSPATLTVTAKAITITTQPVGATQFVGETAIFTVAATGTAPVYQWRKNAAAISGATGATYTTPALAATDDKAVYDVLVSNGAGSVTSSGATVRVGPFATSYTTQKGVVLNLFAWPGTKNAFLTKTSALDPVSIRKILAAADGTWNYYAGTTGTLPSFYFTYSGAGATGTLATIANTGVGGVDLCGDGCTYIGATGMELADEVFSWLYNGVQSNTYDQTMFYEFGRSFWLFSNQISYKSPDDSTCEITGFAILMRYRSLTAQNLTGSYNGTTAQYTMLYANTLPLIDAYAANSSQNFSNIFLTNSRPSPGLGCADLWASMVIRVAGNYGGETYIQSLFKEVLKRPNANSTQDAIDNFVLAASAAAGKNLTLTFGTTWKWPISTAASAEASSKYGPPQ